MGQYENLKNEIISKKDQYEADLEDKNDTSKTFTGQLLEEKLLEKENQIIDLQDKITDATDAIDKIDKLHKKDLIN